MIKQCKKITSIITAIVFVICFYGNIFKIVSDEFQLLTVKATNDVYGDLNNDGVIDVFDLVLLRSGQGTAELSDLDGNSIIDGVDTSILRDYLLGLNDEFPVAIRNRLSKIDYSVVNEETLIEHSLTKEMADFTEELGTPLAIYEYLYNNIDTSFYTNSRKGAIGTFEEKCGNDIDQASLLIAMLRHLGYNANYVTYYIAITEQQLLDWTGCQSIDSAKEVILTGWRSVAEGQFFESSSTIYFGFYHTFVATEIDSEIYLLDTSFKKYKKVNTAYDELDLTLDENIYQNFIDCNLLIETPEIDETWFDDLDNNKSYYFKSNIIEQKTFASFPLEAEYLILIQEENTTAISELDLDSGSTENLNVLAYNSDIDNLENTTIKFDSNLQSNFSISNTTNARASFTTDDTYVIESDIVAFAFNNNYITVRAAELYGKNVTVSYNTVTSKHEVRIDDDVILESSDLAIGDSLELTVQANTNGGAYYSVKELIAGEIVSIVFDFERISSNTIAYAYTDYLNTTETTLKNAGVLGNINETNITNVEEQIDNYNNLGKLLRYVGVEIYAQTHIFNNYLSEMADIKNECGLIFSFISYQPSIVNGVIQKQGYFSTQSAINNVAISRNGNESVRQSYNLLRGMHGCTLEKQVFQKLLGLEGLSPVDIIQEAQLQGTELITLNSSNSEILQTLSLNIPQEEINRIASYIENGYNITIPKEFVYIIDWSENAYADWGGIAYIVTTPESGEGFYQWYGGYGYEGESTPQSRAAAVANPGVLLKLVTLGGPVVGAILIAATAITAIYLISEAVDDIADSNAKEVSIEEATKTIDTAANPISENAIDSMINAAKIAGSLSLAQALEKRLKNSKDYYVYFGIDNGVPVYVGITNNLNKRYYQHNWKWNLLYGEDRFDYLAPLNSNEILTKKQARGVEQVLIERNRGNFQNLINSISIFNLPDYVTYTMFGTVYLTTNQVYNEYKSLGLVN